MILPDPDHEFYDSLRLCHDFTINSTTVSGSVTTQTMNSTTVSGSTTTQTINSTTVSGSTTTQSMNSTTVSGSAPIYGTILRLCRLRGGPRRLLGWCEILRRGAHP